MAQLDNFFDTRTIDSGARIETDLCVIGSGAAGITLAREFAGSGVQVALLETGGLNFEADTDALGKIENVGRPYNTKDCRLRYFGGTTNHWGGHCARFEAMDFEKRDWIPGDIGWPFGLDHLLPYYHRAHQVIEIGADSYDPAPVAKSLDYRLFPFDPTKVKTTLSRYHRQRFGIRYGPELSKTPNVKTYLYATVTSVDLDPNGRSVQQVTVKTLAGNTVTFIAKRFVIATGGIENARLLLDSNAVQTAGIGNENGLVGRYFTEHINYIKGVIRPRGFDPAFDIYTSEHPYEDGGDHLKVRCHLAIPQDLTKQLKIPKFRTEIGLEKQPWRSPFSSHFSMDDITNVFERATAKLNTMATGAPWKPSVYIFINGSEQIPNFNSTITLSAERNGLGQRIAKMNWHLTEIGKNGIVEAHRVIAHEVGRSHFGRYLNYFPDEEERILDGASGGMHHMCTTRMHDDPKQGVVDRDCKVHGVENLYMAGSSVFPNGGWPNPTLTITALAARLADHLKMEMSDYG